MKHEELTSLIIGICISIHEKLGPGLLESVYEELICYELAKRNIPYVRQKGIPVIYDGVRFDIGFRADIIVDDHILLEIKSIEKIQPVHFKIALSYLKLLRLEVGLLINFNVVLLKEGISRLVASNTRTYNTNQDLK
ncbi:MAG TPA: GxxExxY protein [Saprospiraceae bacterium]|nr:GxxExxY protein [Saprospiraceae bacterium]